jgi:NAD(P)-dependent dehydrogenase (short-subunit alcohol dehydrogenase family)
VAPGAIESEMSAGTMDNEEQMKAMLAKIPKSRIGKPEDVASACVFLASEESDYITGSVIYVDGGWLAD